MRTRWLALLALFPLMSLAGLSPASADIVNGGFETGTLSGWTVVGNDVSAATSGGVDIYASHSGRFFAALGDTTGTGALVQTSITDVLGQAYTLTYFLASKGDSQTSFSAAWDGVTLQGSQLTNPNSGQAYVQYTFTVTGTGSDTLTFHETDVPGWLALDDISLTAKVAAVPGPTVGAGASSFALAALFLGWLVRRRGHVAV